MTPARAIVAAACAVFAGAAPVRTAADSTSDLLTRASAFVAGFERVFEAVIWHETYTQEERVSLRFSAQTGTFNRLRERRRLESELLFLWLPANATWLAVRDVVSVDGTPQPPERRRLSKLLAAGPATIDQLRALSDENGRFNIGPIVRTFNDPTLALLFADARYRPRFRFSSGRTARVDGARAEVLEFSELATPTVVRDHDRDLPVTGSLAVDAASGRVLRTLLRIVNERERIRGTMTVNFRYDDRLETMVPREMHESYEGPNRERIDCTAIYSDFRQFKTSGRIIVPQ